MSSTFYQLNYKPEVFKNIFMRISIGQITILVLLLFLLFGDVQSVKKRLTAFLKQLNVFFQHKNRKKGT